MSSKRKSQPSRLLSDQLNTMFPTFPSHNNLKSSDSSVEPIVVDDVERLKAFQQECLQSLLLHQHQQQQLQQNLSQLNKFMEPPPHHGSSAPGGYSAITPSPPLAPKKSMQDTLNCLKSLQLARSLETDTSRYVFKNNFTRLISHRNCYSSGFSDSSKN